MTTPCELVQIEYQGNGSLSVFAFPFPYDFKTEVKVALWNNTTKKHEDILTTDATYPWEVNDANPTAVTFTGTVPPSPPASDVNEDPIYNVKVYRVTDMTDIRSVFNQGSAIRATDLNKNFEQLRYAIQEGKCQIPDKLLEYLDEYYWNNYSDVVYSNETWVSNDQTIATTAALDQRFQDEADETILSTETWVSDDDHIATTAALDARFQDELSETITSSEAWPNNDDTIATTAKIDDVIDSAIENDILVDSTGLTKNATGGQTTIGIGANSVDLDRIKTNDIVQTADYSTTWTNVDDKVATVGALEARHDVIVNSDITAPVTDQPGKQWLNLIPGNQVYRIYDGSNWRAVSVGTPYTPATSTIVRYVDVTNGTDAADVTGFLPQAPLRSIKRALTLVNASATGDGTLIVVAPGTYQEELPLRIEKNNISIVGTSMRSCFVHPTVATENNDMFEVTSGTYISNLTLLGLKVPTSDQGSRNNSLDNDATYGLPSNQPFAVRFRTDIQPIILKSPYIQNCTHFSDAHFDNANFDPNTFQSTDAETYSSVAGDRTSAPCGGGLLVDGAAVSSSSPIRSMVVDAFTQICLDGPGILVTNNGYAQLVSFFGTFTHYHAKAKNGGQLNLSNCVSDFGRYGLIADGKSPNAIATASISSPSAGTGLGNTTVTIGALTQGTFHGTVSQPLNTMMITIDGVDYGVVNSVANGSGWDVTLTSGLTSNITSTTASFALRSYISTGGHTFEFVGVGTNYSDHPDEGGVPIEANQVIELNGGKVWQSSTDQIGKFKAGSTLVVDQVSETVALKDTNVTGTLAVSGDATVADLTVNNDVTVTNDLTVSNDATITDVTVTNNLTVSNNFNISSLQNVIVGSKNLEQLIAERARDSRRIYISKDVKASDSNNGTSPEEPFATFAAAIAAAQPGDLIEVAPGIYTENSLPLRVPRNVGIFASSLRQVQIKPASGQEMNGFFKVDSGFWCWGLEFAGHQADLANNQQSWAISFDDQADNTGIGANTTGAYIFKSPYIQNCSSVTAEDDAGTAGSVSTGDTGGGMEVDGDKCAANSPIRSMVVDSYTQVNLGGPGCLVKNDGYAQLVSFFGTFCTFHVKTETGGQANLSGGGTSDFGDQGLVADGYSRLPNFTGDSRVAVYGADRIEEVVTINTTSDTFTTATNHGLSVNDQVTFKATDGSLPTEIVTGTTYYVINSNFTNTVFSVSATQGGTAVNMTGSATGTYQVTRQGELTADIVSFTSNRIGSLSRPNPGQLMFPRQTFPSAGEPGSTGNAVTVTVTSGNEFTLPLNTFSYAHEYVTGGTVTVGGTSYNVTSAVYDHTTGVITLTASGYTPSNGDSAVLSGLEFICPNQGAYVVTSSEPIDANGNVVAADSPSLAGYRLNFYNTVNGGLRSPLAAGQTIDFRLRSQVSCSLHTMEYVGSGTNYNALPWNGGVPIAANQRVELNNGRVFGATINEKGDFEIGDNTFSIDGTTGSATINTSEFNISGLNFVGPFSRNGGFSTVGVQLREVSDNTSLIASTGASDGNTVPTQNAVKAYVDANSSTNLSYTASTRTVASSTGTDAVITEVVAAGNSGLMTGADKTKLDGVAAGAEVNVNADWNATTGDAFIANKPTIPAAYTDSNVDTHLNKNTANANEVLSWTGTDYDWVAQSGGGGGSYTDSDVDAHLNTGTASSTEILSWTGTDYDWIAQPSGGVSDTSTCSTSIGLGTSALDLETTGCYNTALGYEALKANTIANENTAIGYRALYSNTGIGVSDDGRNTAVGYEALTSNTTAGKNVAIGWRALYSNTGGGGNSENGEENVAVGYEALYFGSQVRGNTAVGYQALYKSSGIFNTAVGKEALKNNSSGSELVAIGEGSLFSNSTGSHSTAIGRAALYNNITGLNNIAVGGGALYSSDFGRDNTAVGKSSLAENTTGNRNTAFGYYSSYNNTTGHCNVAIGHEALKNIRTGSGNIGIGFKTSSSSYSPVFDPTYGTSNRLVMGHTTITDAYVKVAWTVTSDERDKMNFAPVPYGLDFVNQLKPTAYQFKIDRDTETPNGDVRYGFKAQDILALEGDNPVIIDTEDADHLKYKGEHLVPVLVNAVQELTAMVKELQTEIAALKGT